MPQQGFTGESSPLQGSLGNRMAFFGRSEDADRLRASFSDKRERAEAKAQMHAPSCEIPTTVA